jgi:hypothetical protein
METENCKERLRLSECKRPAVTYGMEENTSEISKYRVNIKISSFLYIFGFQ